MSNADVIYSHVNSSNIELIEVDYFEVLATYLINKSCKTMDMAIIKENRRKKYLKEIEPKFRKFLSKKEKETGIKAEWWSEKFFEDVKKEFVESFE